MTALHLQAERQAPLPEQGVGSHGSQHELRVKVLWAAKVDPSLRDGQHVRYVALTRTQRHPHVVSARLVAAVNPVGPIERQEPRLGYPLPRLDVRKE